jgi:hypothetical protein
MESFRDQIFLSLSPYPYTKTLFWLLKARKKALNVQLTQMDIQKDRNIKKSEKSIAEFKSDDRRET